MKKFVTIGLVVVFFLTMMSFALALDNDYPSKPITFNVTSGIGGMTDASARILADKLQKVVGQPISVVNKPGGGGLIGLNIFVSNKLDPYQLAVTVTAHLNAAPFLGAENFDINKLKFVGSYMPQERILFARADGPCKTWEEFVAYAKEHPGKVSVGSGNSQWTLEVLKAIGKIESLDLNYVNFKSGAEGSNAIIGGHVDVCETGVGTPAYQAALAGDLNIILNCGSGSVPNFPDVINVIQKGYPYASRIEYGIVMQAGVSEEIRQFWEDALRTAMEDFDILKKFLGIGLVPRFLPGNLWREISVRDIKMANDLLEFNK